MIGHLVHRLCADPLVPNSTVSPTTPWRRPKTVGAPANLIETVNTLGVPMYARQLARQDGSAIDVKTEASILPVNKRPRLAVRLFSGN